MKYAQLNQDNTLLTEISTDGPIRWDVNNFCSAESLFNDGKAASFDVVELVETGEPGTTPYQTATRDGIELVDGQWRQKWLVTDWSQEQIDAYKDSGKLAKWGAIKAERDRRKFNGVLVNGKWIHSDTFSRTQWMGMVMAGASLPAIPWSTMDNTEVTTTPTLAGQVFQAVMVQDSTLFAIAKAKKTAMEASANPAAYDHLAEWPATFGEA